MSDRQGPGGPEMMLGLWTSWMKATTELLADPGGQAAPVWRAAPDRNAAAGLRQLDETLRKNPLLHSIDQLWNANPLREVVPLDWAEIVQALRTVWLRSLADPAAAMSSVAELNARAWQSAIETWSEAGKRWWGLAPSGEPPAGGDKRFAAPEWQGNPAYGTLRDLYLLASDWLLRQSAEATDLDPAERRRLDFHLRQFVDAMSPTLQLMSNPAALRRAVETGGASLADGARNLLADMKEGRLSLVDVTAIAPGRNLALTPGKVVHR